MRKVIVCNIMSLDGCYAAADGNPAVLPMDASFDAYNVERLRVADTLLLGRPSFEAFKSFWPSVAADDNATPDEQEISRRDNEIEKVVVSDTLTPDDTDPWRDTTRIVRKANVGAELAELKQNGGNESWSSPATHSGTTCWPKASWTSCT